LKPHVDITEPRVVKAMAHPLRVRILAILEEKTASPSELALDLNASLGVVSYHVRKLHALKLIKLVRKVPRRGAVEHYYKADAQTQITDEAWAEIPDIVKRAMVGAVIGQVSANVNSAAAAGGFDRPDTHVSRTPMEIDEHGWSEISKELASALDRIDGIRKEAGKRLESSGEQGVTATLAMMFFEGGESSPHTDGSFRSTGDEAEAEAPAAK
jgi:DNA-binding transcriptional ArsR family regulator